MHLERKEERRKKVMDDGEREDERKERKRVRKRITEGWENKKGRRRRRS